METFDMLAARITQLEARHEEIGSELEEVRQLADQLKRKQIKEGPLAPLAEALAYHHEMVNGWAQLAAEGGKYDKLYVEFVRMREVVTHYEYVAQTLLGINPSPLADLEDKPWDGK